MRKTFTDIELQRKFANDGFILVSEFLSSQQISELRAFYFDHQDPSLSGFHATMHSTDFELRHSVTAKISDEFSKKADKFLEAYRPVVGNFTVKEPGKNSSFDFHLDWNMLDETKARSVTIWTPLEDTNAVNGNLWILPGSNKLSDTFRAGPGLNLLSTNPEEFKSMQFESVVLPMSAGDAIIYDHKLFHASPPNLSDKPRLAINLALLPSEAQALHYFLEKDKLLTYKVPDNFFNTCLTHTTMDMTKYEVYEERYNIPARISQEDVNLMIQGQKLKV